MTAEMFEAFKPDSIPALPDGEACEIAKDLIVALIQQVFQHLNCAALVEQSELAPDLNQAERDRIAQLINSAHVQMEVTWE